MNNPLHRLRRATALLASFLTVTALLGGCGTGGGKQVTGPASGGPDGGTGRIIDQPGWTVNQTTYQQNSKKWTFLVYMNGANNLEEFGILNMNQMEQIGSDANVNLVVQFKRYPNGYDSTNGNWSDTRRFYVTRDFDTNNITSRPLSQHPNKDMGDWRVLREFITWGVNTFPADHYCLVIWNHGAGWRKVDINKKLVTRGVSYDDTTNNHIDTIQLPQAITLDGILDTGHKWDLLCFDASLMQMAEVAHEIRNQATYIEGSEESPPGEGLPYQLFLADLAQNPAMSGKDLGTRIALQTIQAYGSDSNSTQSVLDTSKIGEVTASLNDLGGALFNVRTASRDAIVFARNSAENYDYPENHDILDFVRLIATPYPGQSQPPITDTAVKNAATRVQNAVKAAVVYNANGTAHPNSQGLAIFLPSPVQYNSIDIDQANGFGQRYSALTFAKDAPNWMNFLANGPQ